MKNAPIKILHLLPVFSVGGAERLVLEYFNRLNGDEFEVRVASTVEDGSLRSSFTDESRVKVISRKGLGGRIEAWKELKKYVDKYRPHIIHTHIVSADIFGYMFKRQYGSAVRWISTQHNVEHRSPWYHRAVLRYVLPFADTIIAVSPTVEKYVYQNLGVKTPRLTTILNGIDTRLFDSLSPVTVQADRVFRLAIVGRLEEQKGHEILLYALSQIRNHSWKLVVFGSGRKERVLKALASKLGIGHKVEWRGTVLPANQIYGDVDVVVQPSLWEGLSLTVMEAMASGRAVVVSDAAGGGMVTDGSTGWVCTTGDVASLKTTLEKILGSPEVLAPVAKAAQEHAHTFDIQNNVQKLSELYRSLL